jgi:hypothetical protein
MPIVDERLFSQTTTPSFAWDEHFTLRYFYFLPAALHDRLLTISPNACFALTIGSAEWILARFAPFDVAEQARHFVNAAWAEMTDDWHCARVRFFREDWKGPVLGPIASAMSILYDSIDGRDHNPVLADRAVWMHNLACHVIDPPGPYLAWFEKTLGRMEQFCSWSEEQAQHYDIFDDAYPVGNPVSSEILMPDRTYNTALGAESLRRQVERERGYGNPFVLDDQEFGTP